MTDDLSHERPIEDHIAERARRIADLEETFKRYCEAKGKRFDLTELDQMIMGRYNTTSGRDSLSYEYIARVKEGLEKAIERNKATAS